ncbi:MAG: PilZ domain-containing protein [Gammaproteobacteria bacterium]|jgi:c-di-GMP-binding flagellar brake protein YcgR
MNQKSSNVLMEKRKHKRIQYGRTVNIKTQNGDRLQLEVLDYSMGGMGLVSDVPFEAGDILDFESIMTLDGERRVLEIKGEVRHIQQQFQEYSFGVCFL